MLMWIFLDLIVVIIVAICVFMSVKRGFMRTAIELVGFFLAVYLSFTVSGAVAEMVYENNVAPAVTKSIVTAVGDTATNSANKVVDTAWESMPDLVKKVAEGTGVTKDSIAKSVTSGVNSANTEQIAENVTVAVVKPIVVPLIKTVLGLLLFGLLMILVRILAKIINKAFSIPIVGGINKILGGLFGVGKGLLISYIVCLVITLIVNLTSNGFLIFTKENIEASKIFSMLSGFTPFK